MAKIKKKSVDCSPANKGDFHFERCPDKKPFQQATQQAAKCKHEMFLCACDLQGSFDHRMKAWQRWQDAQAMLQKKRETEAKLLWANKPDKLQLAKEEIAEV